MLSQPAVPASEVQLKFDVVYNAESKTFSIRAIDKRTNVYTRYGVSEHFLHTDSEPYRRILEAIYALINEELKRPF